MRPDPELHRPGNGEPGDLLRRGFDAAVEAVSAARRVPPALPAPPPERTMVLGAGKAAAAMARAVEEHWNGPLEGLVVTRYGHGAPCRCIEVVEAAHPVPDAAGRRAAERILERARGLGPEDLALCLVSGGGSALLALPAPGISLADQQTVTAELLRSGAAITEINAVRKHLSAIHGGRLAAACHPARVVTLAVSDVPGDDPSSIASGPTVPDPTTFGDARAVLERHSIAAPPAVVEHLARAEEETPKPGDPRLAGAEFRLVASARDALAAASEVARQAGVRVRILGEAVEGEAREVGRGHAEIALRVRRGEGPLEPSCLLLSGGETTVTVRGGEGAGSGGRGGRNTEYLLALALALRGEPGVWALAADTDGLDGTGGHAGARVGPHTLPRAAALGLDPGAHLAAHDSYGFFAALGDLLITGPTRTNVNDLRAILVLASG